MLQDIYDGKIWQDFQSYEGQEMHPVSGKIIFSGDVVFNEDTKSGGLGDRHGLGDGGGLGNRGGGLGGRGCLRDGSDRGGCLGDGGVSGKKDSNSYIELNFSSDDKT